MSLLPLIMSEGARSILSPATGGRASDWIRPTIAAVYLTSYCNSKCTMCDFWKRDRDPNELTSEQWGIVFSRLRAFGVRYIGINASGEMFTRRDVFKILQHLQDLDIEFGINTNLTLITKPKAKQLAALKPKIITIGLDGIGDENYEKTRGLKSGFSKVIRSIRYLQDAGLGDIRIGSVMMKENIDDWVKLAEFAIEEHLRGIRFTAYHEAYFQSGDTISASFSPYKDPDFLKLVEENINKLIELKKTTGIVNNSKEYLKRVPEFMASQNKYFPVPCIQGSNRIELDVYANVNLCSFVTHSLGNLLQDEMETIWNSEIHKEARRNAFEGNCPHCFLSCYAEENLRLSPSGFIPTIAETIHRSGRLLNSS